MLCLLLGRICLQTSNDPSTNRSQSQSVLPSEKGIVAQTHIFKHHKAAASIKSSPSRTNTNLNTLQCSFPKPPSIQPLSRPFPRTHPSPQICSATIEKALGLRRWPLQGYDRWSGARSARFRKSVNNLLLHWVPVHDISSLLHKIPCGATLPCASAGVI